MIKSEQLSLWTRMTYIDKYSKDRLLSKCHPSSSFFSCLFQFCMIWLIGCSAGAEQENLTFAIFLLPSCHRHLLPLQSTYCNLLPSSCDCCTFLARCHPPQPQITSWLPFSTTCWSWKKISKYEGLALIWQQLQHLLSAVLLKEMRNKIACTLNSHLLRKFQQIWRSMWVLDWTLLCRDLNGLPAFPACIALNINSKTWLTTCF